MDLSTWTTRGADRARAKRLTAGVFVGILLLCAGGTFIALTSKTVEAAQEEDPVAVELAKSPEPEPEPEPPPPAAKLEAPKPHAPKLSVPTTISDEKPEEKDPVKNDTSDEPEEKAPPPAAPVVQAP
ncbi:MAG TPA: hypothetical protein VGP93_20305, partial [Polyangiaceae bacterium]|nr:hypothetical protein [Polyangiaceae bacterium]